MTIEETVIAFLAPRLTVPVAAEVPPGPPDSYVTVEKTGSREKDTLHAATIAVQSHAPKLVTAMGLNEQVKTALALLTTLPNVFRCHCERDYNHTNTRTKERRYQAIFEIVYKE